MVGLRELARRCLDPISFPSDVGARVLTLLEGTASPVPNHERLNYWLLDWLERCSKHGWRLIKDDIPIPEPVFSVFPISTAASDVRGKPVAIDLAITT